jgi:PAS domain S-box-containing protein
MPRFPDDEAAGDSGSPAATVGYPAPEADLLNQLGLAVVVMDSGRVITHWNAEAERLFGWSAEEALGHHGVDVGLSGGGLLRSVGLAVQVLGGEPVEDDLTVTTRDGRSRLVHFWARPVLAADGIVTGLIAAATAHKLEPAVAELAKKVAAERLADRLHRLQQISERLTCVTCVDDVAEAVVRETTECLNAQAAMVLRVRGDRFEALAATGFRARVFDRYRTFARYEALPAADVLRSRQPLLWPSLADRDRDYPQYARMPFPQKRWAIFPLVVADRAIGTLVLGWTDPGPFDEADVLFLRVVAGQCAQALDRAQVDPGE